LDTRGRETDALGAAGALARLAQASGVEFPAIFAARSETEEKLTARRGTLSTLAADPDTAIVLMGSWGRLEATGGSDDDFMCLVDGQARSCGEVRPSIEETWNALGKTGKRP
jgi:UTP:GlnB (protein PII) uridylyltransferase